MADDKKASLLKMFREVLVPLIEGEGGELYVVSVERKGVRLHLAGTYGGCPGTTHAIKNVIEPAVKNVFPKAKVAVSYGWCIPEAAERVTAA